MYTNLLEPLEGGHESLYPREELPHKARGKCADTILAQERAAVDCMFI